MMKIKAADNKFLMGKEQEKAKFDKSSSCTLMILTKARILRVHLLKDFQGLRNPILKL
jgi:hypothetical protein